MARPASFGFEHRNPLPAGRYWVFRIGKKQVLDFDAWLNKWRRVKALRVVSSEFDPGGPFLATNPPQSFVVWEILTPGIVVWEGPGLPDKSPPHVTSSQDVVSAPTILEPAERLEDAVKHVTRGAETIPVLLFVLGLLFLASTRKNS